MFGDPLFAFARVAHYGAFGSASKECAVFGREGSSPTLNCLGLALVLLRFSNHFWQWLT